jgi:hypothetical protein
MSIEKSIIDYAMDEDGVQFRNALYASIQDKVSAHIEAAKQNLARNLIATEEVSEEDEEEVQEQYQNPLEFSNKPKRTHSYDGMPDPKKRPKYDAVPTSRQLGAKPQPKNEAYNQDSVQKLQAKIDASTEKEVSHAKSLGWHVKNQTYGREYTHPKHGHIAMNRYGEWQHKPSSDFKGGKGQLIAHGQGADLDKHLSSLNK